MGYAKERGKFEKLAKKLNGLLIYDDKSLVVITDIFEQYSHSIRILKNKNPEAFTAFYKNELEQVKVVRRNLRESEEADRQANFIIYKDTMLAALTGVIELTKTTD